ncbi:hypothetical protein AGLY_009297 [Aphis glycines]|uniref:Uncharacterized protein n=1 Tax=Aphis glycines TaxID=307491 RepID=A0A6G0TJ92_APHGL|nr:hypothetical protein AGLY_009297 [Aphis glycines]
MFFRMSVLILNHKHHVPIYSIKLYFDTKKDHLIQSLEVKLPYKKIPLTGEVNLMANPNQHIYLLVTYSINREHWFLFTPLTPTMLIFYHTTLTKYPKQFEILLNRFSKSQKDLNLNFKDVQLHNINNRHFQNFKSIIFNFLFVPTNKSSTGSLESFSIFIEAGILFFFLCH